MFGLGMPEVVLIALVGTLLFGGRRIATFGKDMAEGIRGLKEGFKDDAR